MRDRLEILNKARARMIEDRDAHAKVLAAPFDRDKAERARNKFVESQILVDALNRAISGEELSLPSGWPEATIGDLAINAWLFGDKGRTVAQRQHCSGRAF
jgi:hypothetical protein